MPKKAAKPQAGTTWIARWSARHHICILGGGMMLYEECALDTQYDKEQSRYIREEIENTEKERLRVLKEKQELQKQRWEEELRRA